MVLRFALYNYRQKSMLAEVLFLVIVCIIIPLAIGLQIFEHFSYTIGLILVNSLMVPSIILYYRWYLPVTLGHNRYGLFFAGLPLYLAAYEINSRLSQITGSRLPFLPEGYRRNLMLPHPQDFSYNLFIQNFGYTLLVLLAGTSVYTIKQLFKNQQTMYGLQTDKLKLELSNLKNQVQPHFFFNTLNNMYALSLQENAQRTAVVVNHLSGIMRYVLYESRHDRVWLNKEISFIRSFIELENIRHNDTGLIDFSVQGDTGLMSIEPLLFLPLIENTFKHSLQQDLPERWVKLILMADESELTFQTSNPFRNAVPGTGNNGGIGLANVEKRLSLLYPDQHRLDIHTENNIFTVTLTIILARA